MLKYFVIFLLSIIGFPAFSSPAESSRTPYISNEKVNVWKTTIYPGKKLALKAHRHEFNRVLVALDSGELKVVNNKGEIDYFKLQKGKAYYLPKNKPGSTHSDENLSHHPIQIVVIELKPFV